MNFPILEIPGIGGGMLIGLVSIFHVFVSHFAVGGGLFLVLTEKQAHATNDKALLAYARSHSVFFAFVTLVFGAVSGVGIWFSIALVSPSATSALIHLFVWGWACEWVFFFVEIAAILLYTASWEKLDRSTHVKIGWVYAVSAWMSLFIINGILTFMLTPGKWIENGSLFSAFFNPTFLPSLVIRTLVCLALAGLYAMATASLQKDLKFRARCVRYASRWLLPAFLGLPLAGVWYLASIPSLARQICTGGAPAVTIFLAATVAFSLILFLSVYFTAYRDSKRFSFPLATLFLILGFMATGVTEWVREAVRKPYVIYGYMYSNGILVKELRDWPEGQSLLSRVPWAHHQKILPGLEAPAGRDIFRAQCAACHTADGYNGLSLLVDGWDEDFLDNQIDRLDTLKSFMPPFKGTDAERRALSKHLVTLQKIPSPSSETRRFNRGEGPTSLRRLEESLVSFLHSRAKSGPDEGKP